MSCEQVPCMQSLPRVSYMNTLYKLLMQSMASCMITSLSLELYPKSVLIPPGRILLTIWFLSSYEYW